MGNKKSKGFTGNITATSPSPPVTSSDVPTSSTPGTPQTEMASTDPTAPVWEFEKSKGEWVMYDNTTIRLLEGTSNSGRGNTLLNHGPFAGKNQVVIDFINLTQKTKDGEGTVNIRRRPPLNSKRNGLTSSSEKKQIEEKMKNCKGFEDPGKSKRDQVKKATKWKSVEANSVESCPICLCNYDPEDDAVIVQLSECVGHTFHRECIVHCFNSGFLQCPICGKVYGTRVGNQPPGTMNVKVYPNGQSPCAGYEKYGTIEITYSFPSGTQTAEHPHPGTYFNGTSRIAYLPDNDEGREVLRLLKIGFERKLLFMVGRSVTTGEDNQVVWGGVHHKTSLSGGPTNFGYPDETYFSRVKSELSAKGVV